MKSLTPRLDAWLDNPMVTGYGFPAPAPQPEPIDRAICPRCNARWHKMPEGLADNIMRPWEHYNGAMWITAPDNPVGLRYCRECAISAATCRELIGYIEEHKLQQEALEWALIIGLEWDKKLDPEWAPILWDAMKLRLFESGTLRDYVQDMHKEPFLDWMMERSES